MATTTDALVPFRVVVSYDNLNAAPGPVVGHIDALSEDMPIDCALDPTELTATFTGEASREVVTFLMALAQGHDVSALYSGRMRTS